jgi:hypothetical protein
MLLQIKMLIELWTTNILFNKGVSYEEIISGKIRIIIVLIYLPVKEIV